ncbi:hypothetical protein GCM10010429_53330 [Micromonospora olivasterospora]
MATEATTAAATPCFQTGCRSTVRFDAPGVLLVGTWTLVDMSGSVSSAGRPVRPAHTLSTNGRVRIRQLAKKKFYGWVRVRGDAASGRVGCGFRP